MELGRAPNTAMFTDDLIRRNSIYTQKLQAALETDQCVVILEADKYLATQFKSAANKLKIRLTFARVGDRIYIRPVRPSDQEERLILLLRTPRTLVELQAVRPPLELHIEDALTRMAGHGTAHNLKGKWVLTEKGMDLLPQQRTAAAVGE